MAYIITRLCADCKDTACVDSCPVQCIYEYAGSDPSYPNQLYIHPSECIDCGACEPECPWEAIFEEDNVPDLFKAATHKGKDDITWNKECELHKDDFKVGTTVKTPHPSKEQVVENKKKWGLTP